jgi:hypothetical protein
VSLPTTTMHSEFLSNMETVMSNQQQPLTDLQRIQQSYSSGSQTYTPIERPEAQKSSKRESQSQPPSRV